LSIQKRGRSYVVRWRRDGRQYAKSFTRKEDATAFELEQRRAAQLGAHAAAVPSRQTLNDWLDAWWAADSPLWAASTRSQRQDVLNRWVRPQIGGVRLRDLGPRRVREWRSEVARGGATPGVANSALSVLSAACGAAVRDGHLPANPCSSVRKLPVLVERPRALTPVEVEQIRAGMAALRDQVLVSLLALGGLRPGEALALTWDSVGEHVLIVDRSWSYGALRRTKTGRMRTVEIVEPLQSDLAALKPAKPARGALVVAGGSGQYLDLRNWRNRVWKPACESAGIDAAPYDLRHTYASLLIHEGRSLAYVAASMGHSTAVTTLTHYSHMFDEQRLATGVRMVDAVADARRSVRNPCAPSTPRRLHQAAPRR